MSIMNCVSSACCVSGTGWVKRRILGLRNFRKYSQMQVVLVGSLLAVECIELNPLSLPFLRLLKSEVLAG